ncbi:MAG: hypothetical protein IT371_14175 [Deltaproteobacteria bacterium]|nr:hypothetical protein [Deltaproteobacteria bacterium]
MTARLHLVTGKGGVGKSSVTAALALVLARGGRRVLAVEVFPSKGLARALGASPSAAGELVPLTALVDGGAGALFLASFDGEAALGEYLERRLHLPRLLARIFRHRLYRAFVAAAPGLKELMLVGKLRDALVHRPSGEAQPWDALVVDLGATGQGVAALRMPLAALEGFGGGRGLVERESERLLAFLRDPEQTAVHVLALPEELPLAEARSLVSSLRDELGLPLGQLYVNQCRPPVPASVPRLLDALSRTAAGLGGPDSAAGEDLRLAALRALGWTRLQEEGIARLERESGVRAVRLPRLPPEGSPRAVVYGLAEAIAAEDCERARRSAGVGN